MMTKKFYYVVLLCCASLFPTLHALRYYTREDWKALPSTDNRPIKQPVPYVVIHHTYIPGICLTVQKCMEDMRSMQNYHMSKNWGDIGYNFCVGGDGNIYEGRGWNNTGIHAGPANNFSIGICLIGDFRTDLPTPAQLQATKALILYGTELGHFLSTYKLISHKQVMTTECPGGALFKEISTWPNFHPGHFNKADFKDYVV